MNLASRPLRFIVLVMGLWAGARAWAIWPQTDGGLKERIVFALPRLLPEPIMKALDRSDAMAARGRTVEFAVGPAQSAGPVFEVDIAEAAPVALPAIAVGAADTAMSEGLAIAHARVGSPMLAMLFMAGIAPPPADTSVPGAMAVDSPGRFSGYAWAYGRDGGGSSLAGGGQLGGSQAGIRIDYALNRNLALTARFSSALEMADREAAFGVNWRPNPAWPLHFTVERRVRLGGGGRNAFAAFAAGGVGPVELPADFRLEAYAQGGIVGARRRDLFADGSATVLKTLAEWGDTRFDVGGGVWGAAQPGTARLDVGPRAKLRVPMGKAHAGLALDWRQRIAGNAAPASGPAVTLDTSF